MKKITLLLCSLACLAIGTTNAQIFNMHSFSSTDGYYPLGSLTLSGNVLYGMVQAGGIHGGSIFSINTNGTGYKNIHFFNDTLGKNPQGSLLLSGTVLYGMTEQGGAHDSGIIFSMNTNGTGFKDLFDFGGTKGAFPKGSLVISGGVLYGMTPSGGANGIGCIFSINTNGTGFNLVLTFNGTNGADPYGSLLLSGSTLYGTTWSGGANDYGCVFSISTNGSNYKDLMDFTGVNGSYPEGDLTLSGNTLYGMTSSGASPHTYGDIFSVNTNGSHDTVWYYFNSTNGNAPFGSLTLSGDTLFGMTEWGGSGVGNIFGVKGAVITGINELSANQGAISVYPNPNHGAFTVYLQNTDTKAQVEIYNILGEMVCNSPVNKTAIQISMNVQAGIYLYRVLAENGTVISSGKFIVE